MIESVVCGSTRNPHLEPTHPPTKEMTTQQLAHWIAKVSGCGLIILGAPLIINPAVVMISDELERLNRYNVCTNIQKAYGYSQKDADKACKF